MSNVAVCVRFRPQNAKERFHGWDVVRPESIDHMSFSFKDENSGEATFFFDKIFYEASSQADVYDAIALPIVRDAMNAINGTILAYGQTGAGKTFTMEGPNMLTDSVDMKGILPRVAQSIFEFIEAADATSEFIIKLSMVEIYKEKIRDLFDTSKDNLQVKEDKIHGIFVAGAVETYVQSEEEMLKLLEAGITNRASGTTQMNARSSRSHCVCLLTIQQINTDDRSLRTGKLSLVDLAGSEKLEKTGAEGLILDEAKMINKSLSALGNVINSLTTSDKVGHVPYRDSKLTRILQESLGGNSRTTLLCCCSPSSLNSAETLSTLRFGTRAKQIKNKPKINAQPARQDLERLLEISRQELEQLRTQFILLNARFDQRTEGTGPVNEANISNNCDLDGPKHDNLLYKLQQGLMKKGAPACEDIVSSLKNLFIVEGVIPSTSNLEFPSPSGRMQKICEDSTSSVPSQQTSNSLPSKDGNGDLELDFRFVNDTVDKTLHLLRKGVEDLGRKCEKLLQENGELKMEMIALARVLANSQKSKRPRPCSELQRQYPQMPKIVRPVRGGRHHVSWLSSRVADEPHADSSVQSKFEDSRKLKIPVWSFVLRMLTANVLRPRLSPLSL